MSPDLFDQIVRDTETLGYVGEDLNKQLLYLAASSRKLEDPISVIVISESAAGKSFLIDTVKKLMPTEEVVSVTSLSDQALNYLPSGGLLNKFLILGEAVHSDVVDHQVREMLSAKELSRLVTLKDPKTGELTARTVSTQTVVSLAMSTTSHRLNPENVSRCFLLNTDESEEQTRNIHRSQYSKYSLGRFDTRKNLVPQIILKHHSAQRLLENRIIVNPFGECLDFPKDKLRARRDNDRFMDLIASVCHLRQFQKEEKEADGIKYIECDLEDYRKAYELMVKGVLSSTYSELPSSCIRLYEEARKYCRKMGEENSLRPEEISFTQREVREQCGFLGGESVKKYLRLLCSYEYLHLYRGSGKGERRKYRIVEDEALKNLDLSMILTPEEVEKWVIGQKRG